MFCSGRIRPREKTYPDPDMVLFKGVDQDPDPDLVFSGRSDLDPSKINPDPQTWCKVEAVFSSRVLTLIVLG